jgi:hypothetical protein
MPAVPYDLHIEQGATFTVRFEWRVDDGSSPPSGPLMPTDGYIPRMQIKTRPGGEVLATLDDLGNGLTAVNGVITVRLGADITTSLPQSGVYDLELHNVADPTEVVRLAKGSVLLSPEVTTA